ncbi:hypothetical protein HYV49_03475 [Candidatus Pacearchaeota archaeon]|nr:hypothetical protein [Candidatus Pacearchaeota archaeon]
MKEEDKKPVYVFKEGKWQKYEFKNVKEGSIFSFDKQRIFTSSSDAYFNIDGQHENTWSIVIESNREIVKKNEDILDEILGGKL